MSGRQEIEFSFLWIVRCRANGKPALVVSLVGSFVVILLAVSSVYTSVTRAVEVTEGRAPIEMTRPAVREEKEEAGVERKIEPAPTLRKLSRKKEMPAAEWWPFECWFCVK